MLWLDPKTLGQNPYTDKLAHAEVLALAPPAAPWLVGGPLSGRWVSNTLTPCGVDLLWGAGLLRGV